MANKKRKRKKKTKSQKESSFIGCTAANLHEAGRSEYLAHYVFSSFGTSVPVPRQEDSGLDLYCTLTERVKHRLWPIGFYCVQVKSTPDPWEFADPRSIQWIVEHPLPVFLCVVSKKTATLSIFHTSPRFFVWTSAPNLKRLVMLPGQKGKGYGMPWERAEYQGRRPEEFPLSAPIAEFSLTDILDDAFHEKIRTVLRNWIEHDRRNIFRIQAGLRLYETLAEYDTNDPVVRNIARSWRVSVDNEERKALLSSFVEQAKWLSQHMAAEDDLQGVLRVDLLLRHINALNWITDGVHGHFLYSRLRQHFESNEEERKKNFYAGLDGLSLKINELTSQAMKEAREEEAKNQRMLEAKKAEEESNE